MASETVDYAAVIADLEAKILALQGMVSALRGAMASGALGPMGAMPAGHRGFASAPSGGSVDLPKGALLGKSVPDAVKLYLSAIKEKQTNTQIAQGLKEAGVESTASNFLKIINSALYRLKVTGEVLAFKDGWGLAELYPDHLRARLGDTKKTNGKLKKAKKPKTAKKVSAAKAKKPPAKAKAPAESEQPSEPAGGGIQKQVEAVMKAAPNRVFHSADAAKAVGVEPKGMSLLLGRLAAKGVIVKVGDGGYRAASPTR